MNRNKFLKNPEWMKEDLQQKLSDSISKAMEKVIQEALVTYQYGCAMLHFDIPQVYALHEKIREEDLHEQGLERDPHITLLYGLHDSVDVEQIRKIITPFEFLAVNFPKVSIFSNDQFDVLKLEGSAPYLHDINKALKTLPNTSKFPDYKPHLTLAYLKKGLGPKYVEIFKGVNYTLYPRKVIYSYSTGEKHDIAIRVKK